MLHKLTAPLFLRILNITAPVTMLLMISVLGAGLYFALLDSPADYQQGETVRIMYIHVPAAWMSMLIYATIGACSFGFLVWKNPLTHMLARKSAAIGAMFTVITLATGSLWGKPGWGTWWAWDARLTSVLILLFLYIGYIAICDAFENQERGARAGAILALVGCINLPIIKFSVEWVNTLHQPASVIKTSGPAIYSSMLVPLLLMFFGFVCYYLCTLSLMCKTEILRRKLNRE